MPTVTDDEIRLVQKAKEVHAENEALKKDKDRLQKALDKARNLTPANPAAVAAVTGAGVLPATARDAALEAQGGFRSPREYLDAVLKACMRPADPMDRRLLPFWGPNAEARSEAIKKGQDPDAKIQKAVGSDEARAISEALRSADTAAKMVALMNDLATTATVGGVPA